MFDLFKYTYSTFEPFPLFVVVLAIVSVAQIILFAILRKYSFKQIILYSLLFMFFVILIYALYDKFANKYDKEDLMAVFNVAILFANFVILVFFFITIVILEICLIFFCKKLTSKQMIATLLGFNLMLVWIWFILAVVHYANQPPYQITEFAADGTFIREYTHIAINAMMGKIIFIFCLLTFLSSALYLFYKKSKKEVINGSF